MVFRNEVSNALNRYFSVLSHTGYMPYNRVNKLVVLSFIEELVNGPMSEFITDDDYKSIVSSVTCLQGSCIIPYPSYRGYDDTPVLVPDCCC